MATMTFYDAMIITDENGEVHAVPFTDNMDVFEDALEQVAPEDLENIRNVYEDELSKAQDEEAKNNAYYYNFEPNIKKLVQKNWDAVYNIIADYFE